jgi:hypothetical protein
LWSRSSSSSGGWLRGRLSHPPNIRRRGRLARLGGGNSSSSSSSGEWWGWPHPPCNRAGGRPRWLLLLGLLWWWWWWWWWWCRRRPFFGGRWGGRRGRGGGLLLRVRVHLQARSRVGGGAPGGGDCRPITAENKQVQPVVADLHAKGRARNVNGLAGHVMMMRPLRYHGRCGGLVAHRAEHAKLECGILGALQKGAVAPLAFQEAAYVPLE